MNLRLTLAALLAAAGLLAPTPGLAVDGFNLPGSDYANFVTNAWWLCRNTCGADGRCMAWTWVKPGIQGPAGRCWLKHSEPRLVRDACCNSGVHRNILPEHLKPEPRTNRPGQDYRNFETGSVADCQAACSRESACASWTHVRPGVQGPAGRCWLKRGVPYPVDDGNTVSGVKWRPSPVRID